MKSSALFWATEIQYFHLEVPASNFPIPSCLYSATRLSNTTVNTYHSSPYPPFAVTNFLSLALSFNILCQE